jgi:hypothetical protein
MYDARWDDLRERDDGCARVYDERDRSDHEPRDGLMHDLDLPRGEERELLVDLEGILAFAERILPRASDLWVQASLDYKQRLQQLFFPEGIAFDGNRFHRTAATAPLFNYLAPSDTADEKMVSPEGIEPSTNRLRVFGRAKARRRRP